MVLFLSVRTSFVELLLRPKECRKRKKSLHESQCFSVSDFFTTSFELNSRIFSLLSPLLSFLHPSVVVYIRDMGLKLEFLVLLPILQCLLTVSYLLPPVTSSSFPPSLSGIFVQSRRLKRLKLMDGLLVVVTHSTTAQNRQWSLGLKSVTLQTPLPRVTAPAPPPRVRKCLRCETLRLFLASFPSSPPSVQL